jgi:PH (Pleckstrin Homology) domain-containing protein
VSAVASKGRVFRLPALAYIPVIFLLFGAAPVAFTGNGIEGSPARISATSVLLAVPIIVAVFVARTATVVTGSGILVRAVFGSRALPWSQIRGLSVSGRSVYAVVPDGAVRLPCVRVANLAEVARASDGRLPELAEPTPKFAPSRRRRR